jgi:hypothetical protein
MESKLSNSKGIIPLKIKNPLYEALSTMNIGDYVDVECNRNSRAAGNLVSAKIAAWKKIGKVSGSFSRKYQPETDLMRVIKIS